MSDIMRAVGHVERAVDALAGIAYSQLAEPYAWFTASTAGALCEAAAPTWLHDLPTRIERDFGAAGAAEEGFHTAIYGKYRLIGNLAVETPSLARTRIFSRLFRRRSTADGTVTSLSPPLTTSFRLTQYALINLGTQQRDLFAEVILETKPMAANRPFEKVASLVIPYADPSKQRLLVASEHGWDPVLRTQKDFRDYPLDVLARATSILVASQ